MKMIRSFSCYAVGVSFWSAASYRFYFHQEFFIYVFYLLSQNRPEQHQACARLNENSLNIWFGPSLCTP